MSQDEFYPVTKKELQHIRMTCLHPEFNGDCRSNKCECYHEIAHACNFESFDLIEMICKRKIITSLL